MERNFQNEFERFLKENADQYRLYPSAKVWNGIYASLHTRRKWFGLGIILLLITGSLVTLLITHSSKETATDKIRPVEGRQEASVATTTVLPQADASVNPVASGRNDGRTNKNGGVDAITSAFVGVSPAISGRTSWLADETHPLQPIVAHSIPRNEALEVKVTDELTDQTLPEVGRQTIINQPANLGDASPFNWTIESVVNSFMRKNKRLTFQVNITPTISYRKLSANKSFPVPAGSAPASYAPLYDINSVVTHKPNLGLEFGLTSKYALAKDFRLKGGLQFNINGYDIKAFNSPYQIAKIDLRGSRGVDSIYAFSTHRNFNGYKSSWLHNFYFEISMPLGIEINLAGDDKVQFGIAGTVQPTYVLGDRAYLLSSDYKNYARVPWLIRRWNVNTGLETFVAYSTGKIKWQVGPQVRYQLQSSFIDQYPVKENLFDFGLKVGVSLTK